MNNMKYCNNCGAEIDNNSNFCKECGKNFNGDPIDKPSDAWYIWPIFFGIFGGIICYFSIKNRDKQMAKNLIYVGIGAQVFWFIVGSI